MTKELVEEVARVLCRKLDACGDTEGVEQQRVDHNWRDYEQHATALLPILARQREEGRNEGRNEGIEAAAKVADTPLKVSKYCDDCCIDTAEDIATAIRALKEPE